MIYILAFFLPPLALLLEGHVFHAIANAVLWVIFLVLTIVSLGVLVELFLICSAHAIIVIAQGRRRREHRELVDAARDGRIRS
ncbi:MAG: hypothetical protein AAF321_05705 [Pseudomonadota bacterium]